MIHCLFVVFLIIRMFISHIPHTYHRAFPIHFFSFLFLSLELVSFVHKFPICCISVLLRAVLKVLDLTSSLNIYYYSTQNHSLLVFITSPYSSCSAHVINKRNSIMFSIISSSTTILRCTGSTAVIIGLLLIVEMFILDIYDKLNWNTSFIGRIHSQLLKQRRPFNK